MLRTYETEWQLDDLKDKVATKWASLTEAAKVVFTVRCEQLLADIQEKRRACADAKPALKGSRSDAAAEQRITLLRSLAGEYGEIKVVDAFRQLGADAVSCPEKHVSLVRYILVHGWQRVNEVAAARRVSAYWLGDDDVAKLTTT